MAILAGNEEPNRIAGTDDDDLIDGLAGDDTLVGAAGSDTLDGGAGFDEADYSGDAALGGGAAVAVDLFAGKASDGFSDADILTSIEAVRGTAMADTLFGGAAVTGFLPPVRQVFRGLEGTDRIENRGGADIVVAYDLDSLYGGTAGFQARFISLVGWTGVIDGFGDRDDLSGAGVAGFIGTAAADSVGNQTDFPISTFVQGNAGDDRLSGVTASYADDPAAVRVDLGARTAADGFGGTDSLSDIFGVIGSAFADTILGGDFFDDPVIDYRAPNRQRFEGGAGNDTIDGGNAADTVSYRGDPAGAMVDLRLGSATDGFGDTDTLFNIENALGSDFADTLFAGAADSVLDGQLGDDALTGGPGMDVIQGFDGVDTLLGGAGDDTLTGGLLLGDDSIYQDAADAADVYVVQLHPGSVDHAYLRPETSDAVDLSGLLPLLEGYGAGENPFVTGHLRITATDPFGTALLQVDLDGDGTGADFTAVMDFPFAFPKDLTAANLQGFDPIDRWVGTDANDVRDGSGRKDLMDGGGGDDRLAGAEADDSIFGGGGEDTLYGESGVDTLSGGDGEDALSGGDDADSLFGGDGADTLTGAAGDDQISGNGDDDVLHGEAGADTISGGSGNDRVNAGSDDDSVHGGAGDDTLQAGSGRDRIDGGEGDDFLAGGDGDDALDGGAGRDVIIGGFGSDTLSGGSDDAWDRLINPADGVIDVYVPAGTVGFAYDQVEGFEPGIDMIDLSTTGARALSDLGFSEYVGTGIKVILPNGSGMMVVGQDLGAVTDEWFVFA